MKKFSKFVLVLLGLLMCSSTYADDKVKQVYAFGLSASFTDSLVYYTEIQLLDGVALTKEKFLPFRNQYSYQLEFCLEEKMQLPNRTCMIYFSESKKKLSKELQHLINRYKKSGITPLLLPSDEFKFIPVEE